MKTENPEERGKKEKEQKMSLNYISLTIKSKAHLELK